jgi:hypothetical protein
MKYLSFIRCSESYRRSGPSAALMEAMGSFVEKALRDGTLVDTGGLLPSKDGLGVRLAKRKIAVTDGPFTETKEVIGGWAVLQGTRAEVLRVATESCTGSTGPDSRASLRSGRSRSSSATRVSRPSARAATRRSAGAGRG